MKNPVHKLTNLAIKMTLSSVYTEALPNHPTITPIDQIDVPNSSLFQDWLEALFKRKEVAYQFKPPEKLVEKVRHLYFQNGGRQIDKKPKYIGFGYPILVRKNNKASNGISAIPLFIWEAYLQPDEEEFSLWKLTATSKNGYLNPYLRGLSPEINTLVNQCESTLSKSSITEYLCTEFSNQLAEVLKYSNSRPPSGIELYPPVEELMNFPGKGQILWTGVLGNFPKIINSPFREDVLSKEYWLAKGAITTKRDYQLDYLVNDHFQKGVQKAVAANRFLAVEAPTGTGKSRVVMNILTEHLMNGTPTLVVSSHSGYLQKILAKLTANRLSSYAYLFSDFNIDKDRLLELIGPKYSAITELKSQPILSEYEARYASFNELSNQLNQIGRHFSQNVFDIHNRAETIGLVLKNNKQVSKNMLARHLRAADFRFNRLEYARILDKLAISKQLFKEAFSFKHPLTNLNDSVFLYENKQEGKEILHKHFQNFLLRARDLQQDAIFTMGAYKEQLAFYFDQYEKNIQSKINDLGNYIDAFDKEFKGTYKKTSIDSLKWRGTFSKKPIAALPGKLMVIQLYDQLKEAYQKRPYFDFKFTSIRKGNMVAMRRQLKGFAAAFDTWRQSYAFDLKESVQHISSKTAHKELSFVAHLASIEKAIDQLVKDINEVPLFQEAVQNNGMTLPLKLRQLENLIEQLNYGYYHLQRYEEYFEWRRHWQEMKEVEKKVLEAVLVVRPTDWQKAFKSWYFQNLLEQQTALKDLDYDELLKTYLKEYDVLVEQLPDFIRTKWAADCWLALQSVVTTEDWNAGAFLEKVATEKDFIDFYQKHSTLIQRFFPIQLMTQEQLALLNNTGNLPAWEEVIILGAANLSLQEGSNILSVANKVTVFGTGNQGQYKEQRSFWQLAKKLSDRLLFLKKQHLTSPLPLLHFSNATFHHYLQMPTIKPEDTKALQIIHTKGSYDEKNKINKLEITAILEVLKDLLPAEGKEIPVVGIACATYQQRDQLAAQLLQIQQAGATNSHIIESLNQKGLGVFTYEELIGHHFDLLLVSLTYGITKANKVSDDISSYNTPEGYHQLQCLLTADTKAMYVFSSFRIISSQIPQGLTEGTGLFLFYNFLEYLVANQNTNRAKMNIILKRLSDNPIGTPIEDSSKAFNEEVAAYLGEYIDAKRIASNIQIGDHQYPVLINPILKRKKPYILLVDSYVKDAETFSFLWQRHQQHILEEQGYHFIQIWSEDWWHNPKEQARQLAGLIIADDNDFS